MPESAPINSSSSMSDDFLPFSGTSITGDFREALQNAIADAKRQLHSSLVNWQLANLTGVNGGYIGQTDLTVEIWASAGGVTEPQGANGAQAATGPDKRYSYHTGYLYFAFGPFNTPGKGTAFIIAANQGSLYGTQLTFRRNLTLGGVDGWVYRATGFRSDHESMWFASTPNAGGVTYTIKHKKVFR